MVFNSSINQNVALSFPNIYIFMYSWISCYCNRPPEMVFKCLGKSTWYQWYTFILISSKYKHMQLWNANQKFLHKIIKKKYKKMKLKVKVFQVNLLLQWHWSSYFVCLQPSSPYGTFQGVVTFMSQFNSNVMLNSDLNDTKRQKFRILMK